MGEQLDQPTNPDAALTPEQAAQEFAIGLQQFISDFTARTGYIAQPNAELHPLIEYALRLANAPIYGWPVPITWTMIKAGP